MLACFADVVPKLNIFLPYVLFIIIISWNVSSAFSSIATLAWDAPTTNADGTPLTDLAGFKIYYGASSGNYSQNINVGNVTTYTVDNLTEGLTYYFATTAYDTAGNESKYSNEVSKTTSTLQQCTLTVNKGGTGAGTVTSSPAGINCGSDCTETYNTGIVATLTASPGTGSTFAGWSGGGCVGNGKCILTINAPTTVTSNFAAVSTPTEIIIDNRNATTSKRGTWSVSRGAKPYGADSFWSRDGATFTWYFTPPQSGNYKLSMWWTYWSSRSTSVPVDIEHSGATTRVYINQQQNGGKWNIIGTYLFEAGKSYRVTITAHPYPSSTCADTVKFVYIPGGNGDIPLTSSYMSSTFDKRSVSKYVGNGQNTLTINAPSTATANFIANKKTNRTSKGGKKRQTSLIESLTIQIGSFKELSNATRLKIELEDRYSEVYINEVDIDGSRYYRVRIGKYQTTDETYHRAKTLADEGYKIVIIKSD